MFCSLWPHLYNLKVEFKSLSKTYGLVPSTGEHNGLCEHLRSIGQGLNLNNCPPVNRYRVFWFCHSSNGLPAQPVLFFTRMILRMHTIYMTVLGQK